MGCSDTMRIILSVLLIVLNVLAFTVGIVLMSLGAWQFVSYTNNPPLYELVYGVDAYEVLIFFMTSGAFLAVLSVLGLLAGLFSLLGRAKCFAAALLLIYTALLFALYTLQVISVSLDFSQFFEGKDNINATVGNTFMTLLNDDTYFNSTSAQSFKAWQSKYMCCGWLSGTEYAWSAYAGVLNNTTWRPESCCGPRNTTAELDCVWGIPSYYADGCHTSFINAYNQNSWSFIGISVAAAVIEALSLAVTFFLIGLVRCSGPKSEKE